MSEDDAMEKVRMSEANEIDFTRIDGKQVDCVQSVLRAAGKILAFTVRFSDGTLLRVGLRQ